MKSRLQRHCRSFWRQRCKIEGRRRSRKRNDMERRSRESDDKEGRSRKMELYVGKGVNGGIAVGKIKIYRKNQHKVKRSRIHDVEEEIGRFHRAQKEAQKQLAQLFSKAVLEVGDANASIFEVHRMMLEDEDYMESVENMIALQNINAEFAIASTGDNFSKMFQEMDDEYMKARAADVKDISERMLSILQGEKKEEKRDETPVILLAQDLTPSETVQLDKSVILAFATVMGSGNSHTAILARTMGIPALVSTKILIEDWMDGKNAIVDGFNGKLILEPTDEILYEYYEKIEEIRRKEHLLQEMKGKDTITLDGKRIKLYANVGGISDVMKALQNDAEGIGLFRTEFLYMERDDYPTEEEQFQVYKTAVESMGGRLVVIRTCDIGADKQADYFQLDPEENPALGYRAIRVCLDRTDMFKAQLKAIYRASAFGKIAVMYPMIISQKEMKQIQKLVKEVKEELVRDGIGFGQVEQGIMIETPAAALISEELAKEVDFFSIGSNDLCQYTFALDRQNSMLEKYYDEKHPAVLRLIEQVIKNGHRAGIWVGICGEMGADPAMTEQLVRLGIDEISVSPSAILPLREKIRMCKAGNICDYVE